MNVIQDKPETMSGLDFRESLEGQPQLFDKCDTEKNTDWSRLDIRESLEVQNILLKGQPCLFDKCDIEKMDGWYASPYYKLNGAWPELKKTRIQTSLQKIFFNNFVDPIGDKIFNFMYPLNQDKHYERHTR